MDTGTGTHREGELYDSLQMALQRYFTDDERRVSGDPAYRSLSTHYAFVDGWSFPVDYKGSESDPGSVGHWTNQELPPDLLDPGKFSVLFDFLLQKSIKGNLNADEIKMHNC